jgi:hypothetical protein
MYVIAYESHPYDRLAVVALPSKTLVLATSSFKKAVERRDPRHGLGGSNECILASVPMGGVQAQSRLLETVQ